MADKKEFYIRAKTNWSSHTGGLEDLLTEENAAKKHSLKK